MPVFKYFAVVGSSLLVLMFVSDAYFGDGQDDSRFNGSLYESAMYAPRLEEKAPIPELQFTRDATPADHVREVFARYLRVREKTGRRG
jgi:hypothetical protein